MRTIVRSLVLAVAAALLSTIGATGASAAVPSCVADTTIRVAPGGWSGIILPNRAVRTSARFAQRLADGGAPARARFEDSSGVWDARHRGNGVGRSFIATPNGRTIYVCHALAHVITGGGR